MSLAISFVVAIVGVFFALPFVDRATAADLSNMLDSLSSVAGTFGGFLFTGVAVVVSVSDRKILQELNRVGAVKNLLRMSVWAVLLLMLVAVSGAFCRVVMTEAVLRPASLVLLGMTLVGCSLLIIAGRQYLMLFRVL